MTSKSKPPPSDAKPLSLRRWSQRKHEMARAATTPDAVKRGDATSAASGASPPPAPSAGPASSVATTDAVAARAELPPVESLTPDSDFTAFFDANARVAETVKRAALKQLLRDPRFNVMDGLDTYIDDYTREDPIPESVLKRLVQSRAFRDPNPEEQAEEQAQRDAAIAQAQGGEAVDSQPQTDGAPPLAGASTPSASPLAADATPGAPPPKKP